MGDFGSVHWKDLERFLFAHGCELKRTKGDHRIYTKPGVKRPLIIPQYNPLPAFIVLNNLRVLGVSKGEFLKFLRAT